MIGCSRVADPGFRDQRNTATASFIVLGGLAYSCASPCIRVGSETSECYCHLIRAGTRAAFAYPVGVSGMAAAIRVIGIEVSVRDVDDQHSVTINVDAAGSRPGPC